MVWLFGLGKIVLQKGAVHVFAREEGSQNICYLSPQFQNGPTMSAVSEWGPNVSQSPCDITLAVDRPIQRHLIVSFNQSKGAKAPINRRGVILIVQKMVAKELATFWPQFQEMEIGLPHSPGFWTWRCKVQKNVDIVWTEVVVATMGGGTAV